MNDQFPEIVVRLRRSPGDWVMDGELVVPDVGGHPSFEGIRRRSVMRRPRAIATAARETPAALCLFDLLLIQDRDLRSLAQVERKQRLRELVPEGGGLQIVKSIESHGEALFTKACELDIEGIVAKRIDASYVAGPQIAWLARLATQKA
jgi:ATP-dependent DNA ligase